MSLRLFRADVLSDYFRTKVDRVRQLTSSPAPPTFTQVADGVCLSSFRHVRFTDISSTIEHLPDKSRLQPTHVLPTGILRRVADLLPFIAYLFNHSFDCGTFPSCFKDDFLTPVIKKSGLSASDPSYY
jgi:hypothetical protein